MSLATKLEQAIAERDAAIAAYAALSGEPRTSVTAENYRRVEKAKSDVQDILRMNESAILAALKFTEAVERHSIRLIKLQNGSWHAYSVEQDKLGHSNGTTPAAAVASLVAELEKK